MDSFHLVQAAGCWDLICFLCCVFWFCFWPCFEAVLHLLTFLRALIHAWVQPCTAGRVQSRRDALSLAPLATLLALEALPDEAHAASTAPSKWAGKWNDPESPGCRREIVMSFDGTKGRLMGSESTGMNPGTGGYKNDSKLQSWGDGGEYLLVLVLVVAVVMATVRVKLGFGGVPGASAIALSVSCILYSSHIFCILYSSPLFNYSLWVYCVSASNYTRFECSLLQPSIFSALFCSGETETGVDSFLAALARQLSSMASSAGLTAAEMAREKRLAELKQGCGRGDTQKFWEAKLSSPGRDSDELTIDLSKSGLPGPGKVVAKWDGDGILFPDGSKWTRTGGFSGGRGS